jgi:hypothetical protein
MKRRVIKVLLWTGLIAVVLLGAGTAAWFRAFRHYPPKAIRSDIRAGLAARHVREPKARVEAFLEARYGPLNDPANRQRAFLGFFELDHIQGLHFIVTHTPANQKRANTQAMADWIAHYRATMTPEERAGLQARLNAPEGEAMLRRAAAQYRSQDVYYRAAQQPVITELLTTVAALRKP